ncbi:hypothetical protein VTN31DRAFT_6751 [Thermomyces dupontii]|uniref:uncharacterized protein n=1 Tax=Talaromyces thermophilus TaxID=28565 RepID=UPI0037446281
MSQKQCLTKVNLAGNPASVDIDSEQRSSMEMDVDDPSESNEAQCAHPASELTTDEANESSGTHQPVTAMELSTTNLDEGAHNGYADVQDEALWHARLGHLNLKDSRIVLQQTGTPYRQMTSSELQAMPQCPACMTGKQHRKRSRNRRKSPRLHSTRIFELIHSDNFLKCQLTLGGLEVHDHFY